VPTKSDRLETAPPAAPPAGEEPNRTRAAALPPSQRRAAIVEATLPLLLTHGAGVTTRQIAEAAGIAEGTIFRVFPDKEHLINAVIDAALDSKSVDAALAAIDPALPLESRLVAAVDILRRRFADVHQLRTTVETMRMSKDVATRMDRHRAPDLHALAALFEPDSSQLRRDPLEAAHLLRGVTIAGTHPALIFDAPLSSSDIVSLFLDGVRRCDADGSERGDA
jgi:AcrR family transcriptional regulator